MDNCDWETKISNNEKHVRVMGHTILTTTFTTCGRHASSERSENGSHWNQKLGGGSNVSLSSATRKVPCSNHGGAMQVVNGRNTAVAGTKALEGQTLAEACWETPENPVSD